ncbi:hypothetical protein D3C75_622980 [compost metagenome]
MSSYMIVGDQVIYAKLKALSLCNKYGTPIIAHINIFDRVVGVNVVLNNDIDLWCNLLFGGYDE